MSEQRLSPVSHEWTRRLLLICGVAAAIVYVATDIVAASIYPGFSFSDQAVSELFAIGAPTHDLVVVWFTASSFLLLAFSAGIAFSTRGNRALQLVALMFALSAIDAIVLWNVFPMHMRGAARTFTDTMHLVLGANPFVWLSVVFAAVGFRTWFRSFSLAVLVVLFAPAVFAFHYAPALDMGQPTPGLGLAERFAQYGYQVWQVMLAALLLRRRGDTRAK